MAEMVSALLDQEREDERKPEVNVNLEIMDITAIQERSNNEMQKIFDQFDAAQAHAFECLAYRIA